MEFILSSKQMKEADLYTIDSGISSLELMEKAGHAVYKQIISRYNYKNGRYLVVVGKGGNGGDGFVVARLLYENKYDVTVLDINDSYSQECLINKKIYKGKTINQIKENIKYDVIIDAIFGVGLNTNIKDKYLKLIEYINRQTEAKIVSIDINSGLDADNGLTMPTSVKSNLTIAIQEYKLGHFLNEGQDCYDELIKVDIGIKASTYDCVVKTLNKDDLKELFPKRKRVSNKGNYGRVLLIGGSKELNGAILFSHQALCPLLLGAGYSTIGIPKSLHNIYALKNLENTYLLFDDENGFIKYDKKTLNRALKYDVIAIGMGIGISKEVYEIIGYLLSNYKGNLLIDADGINTIAKYGIDILKDHLCNVILTPHLKEFSRLINKEIHDFKAKYLAEAEDFAKKYNINLVLKSNVTVITNGKENYLNINGNPGLAKGGSGDLLSGIIAGMLTRDKEIILECAASCYILGRAADLAILDINEHSLLPSNVVQYIPKVINEIIFKS